MNRDPPELPPELEKLASRDATVRLVLASLGLIAAIVSVLFLVAPLWRR